MKIILESIRAKYDLPALGATVFTSDGVTGQWAVGMRKRGMDVPVTVNDVWHLGSCTKMMTATMAGTLVAEGKLSWSTEVASLFPEMKNVAEQNKRVTLGQTLSHRAGWEKDSGIIQQIQLELKSHLPPGATAADALQVYMKWWCKNQPPLPQQREAATRTVLETAPAFPVGRFHYSNSSYLVAGTIAEKISGKPWEEMIRERIFGPLGMSSVGFGGLGTPGQIDQPWPHNSEGKPMPFNGPDMDGPRVLAPAGMVHCTMADWAKFLSDQLRGAEGKPAMLAPEIYKQMQNGYVDAGEGGQSGYGWVVFQKDWAGGKTLTHSGSNDMNTCLCWLAPGKDVGFLVCTNEGGGNGYKACDEVVAALINQRLSQTITKP